MESSSTCNGTRNERGLKLLALDGGGIRGISELAILEKIMDKLQDLQDVDNIPRPCDYFDVICGTSTGGLIAILLGRLKMTVPEAIQAYASFAREVFSSKRLSKAEIYDENKLENVVKQMVKSKLGENCTDEKMNGMGSEGCKVFVCAVPAKNIEQPRLFRTYDTPRRQDRGYNCTIWQAARATSAAPPFFPSIEFGMEGLEESYIDAGYGTNNPVKQLIEEASLIYEANRLLTCIISIGTGIPKVNKYNAPNWKQKIVPTQLVDVLKKIATESERTAEEVYRRFQRCPGLYHRLNVAHGMEDIELDEWDRLGEVITQTKAYMGRKDIDRKFDEIAIMLADRGHSQRYIVGSLDPFIPVGKNNETYFNFPESSSVSHYIPREGLLQEIEMIHSQPVDSTKPPVAILLGMGGTGKTQLAIEYCRITRDREHFKKIFWIDANSPQTIAIGFIEIARLTSKDDVDLSNADTCLRHVKEILKSSSHHWLIVFDNFDNLKAFKKVNVQEYFPSGKKGAILFTSRHASTKRLGDSVRVAGMSPEEGLKLLFRRTGIKANSKETADGKVIVEKLGYLALAIDQAGSYISYRPSLPLSSFIEHYELRKKKILTETPAHFWQYKKGRGSKEDESNLSVFTTMEMSFEQMDENPKRRQQIEHFLTVSAFFDNLHIPEAIFRNYFELVHPAWMELFSGNGEWDGFRYQDVISEIFGLSLLQDSEGGTFGINFGFHPLIQEWLKLRSQDEAYHEHFLEASWMLCFLIQSQNVSSLVHTSRSAILLHIDALANANTTPSVALQYRGLLPVYVIKCFVAFYEYAGQIGKAITLLEDSVRLLEERVYSPNSKHKEEEEDIEFFISNAQAQVLESKACSRKWKRHLLEKSKSSLAKNVRSRKMGRVLEKELQISAEEAPATTKGDLGSAEELVANVEDSLSVAHKCLADIENSYLLRKFTSLENFRYFVSKLGELYIIEKKYNQDRMEALSTAGKKYGVDEHRLHGLIKTDFGFFTITRQLLEEMHYPVPGDLKTMCILFLSFNSTKFVTEQYVSFLQKHKQELGDEHYTTLCGVWFLAKVYEEDGDYKKAVPLMKRVVDGITKQLWPAHTAVLESKLALGTLYVLAEEYELAVPYFEEVFEIQQRISGLDDARTQRTRADLETALAKQPLSRLTTIPKEWKTDEGFRKLIMGFPTRPRN